MRILIVNGNTTQAITDLAVGEARRAATSGTEVVGVTARFGAAFVSNAAQEAVAAHAVLDALARLYRGADAAVLAISLDSGLAAARGLLPIPVVGMTEAALFTACMLGDRFGMIVLGRDSPPLYGELLERYGVESRLAECRSIERSLLGQDDALAERIAQEARTLAANCDIGAVVVCGVVFTGMASRVQAQVPVPLLDGIACGVRQAESLVRAKFPLAYRSAAGPAPGMTGVSPELAALSAVPPSPKDK